MRPYRESAFLFLGPPRHQSGRVLLYKFTYGRPGTSLVSAGKTIKALSWETKSPDGEFLSPATRRGDKMLKLKFNEKQRENLVKLCYDIIKLVVGGIAVAGIMQKDPPGFKILFAFAACVALLVAASLLEKDNTLAEKKRGRGG